MRKLSSHNPVADATFCRIVSVVSFSPTSITNLFSSYPCTHSSIVSSEVLLCCGVSVEKEEGGKIQQNSFLVSLFLHFSRYSPHINKN